MIRRNLLAIALVAWMHGNVAAFQQLPFHQRPEQRIGGDTRDTTRLLVQSTETTPGKQQENEEKDDSETSNARIPHFAQGDPLQQPRGDVEKEPTSQSMAEADVPKPVAPSTPPPPSAVELQMGQTSSTPVKPTVPSVPAKQPSVIVDNTFDDAVQPRKPTIPSTPPPPSMFAPKEEGPSATMELLEAVRDATVAGTMELLKGLRYATATALTASLPDQEKSQLLSQIKPLADEREVEVKVDEEEDARGSVQEEIALAVREEVRKNEQQWQTEREEITKKLEAAAEARMKSELEIQQRRLEAEKKAWQEQNTASSNKEVTELQEKINALEEQLRKSMEAKAMLEENKVKQQRDEMMVQTTGLDDVEAMLRKRKQQQAMLEKVEQDLREKAEMIKAEKEELKRLEKETSMSQKSQDREEVPYLTPKEYRALSPQEKAEIKAKRETVGVMESVSTESAHPVLGPAIADLGYKRIHLVSSGKLGTIPIWNRQRTYRNDRARRMASDKLASMQLGFPGVVCLYEDSKGSLSILDGQHRVGMMQTLREMRNKNGGKLAQNDETIFENVLVEVYSDATANATDAKKDKSIAEQVFLEINKAEPVKMLDLPGVASADDRKLITEAVAALKDQFPKMFSTSQRCKSPNVNIDNLRNSIYGANILQRHKDEVATANQLLNWLLVQNAAVGESYENDPKKQQFISSKAWKKASKAGFYLGLESSWLFS